MLKEKYPNAEKFAKDNWPLVFGGAFASAAVLLVIRYYRHRKSHGEPMEDVDPVDLDQARNEAMSELGETETLVDIGYYLHRIIPNLGLLALALSRGLDEGKARDMMEALALLGLKGADREIHLD